MSDDPELSDVALVAAYRSGDELAASELVRRHAAALGRFLASAGADRADLEDLVQETFFKAFRALTGFRGDSSFRSWLFRIGANLRKDWYRREGRRQVLPIEGHDIADRADPEGDAGAAEMERKLMAGLDTLPRLQREVFLLRAQQGMPYEQICRVLDTSPGAARVHYHHAVRRLKDLMG